MRGRVKGVRIGYTPGQVSRWRSAGGTLGRPQGLAWGIPWLLAGVRRFAADLRLLGQGS